MLPNWVVHEDINWSLDPKALRDIYKESNFELQFYERIAKSAIKILSPKFAETHQIQQYDEDVIYKNLIGPLEKFVCGLDENATRVEVDQTFQLYQSLNQQSKICRRILKTGDVTFSCHDCGLDSTCVVCIDCFHKSAHKDHNYRMSNSEGGGCCDCGDIEAWKQNYACSDHSSNEPNLSISDFEDEELRSKFAQADERSNLEKINRLPKDVSSRYYAICQASLHYAHKLLTWDNFDFIPPHLNVKPDKIDAELEQLLSHEETSKQYFTVLFNDEVHTYDHVINTLVKIIKCTQMTASIIASTISREGRSLIVKDNYKACKQVRDLIAGVRESGALRVEVIHGSVLAHQAFAIRLVEWVRKMSSLCDAFRIITAYTLLGPDDSIVPGDRRNLPPDDYEMTLVERIMLSNTIYWKIARVEWNDLFVTTLLTEYSIKAQYSRLITRIYPKIVEYFFKDDHDYSVSILTMTTQIYTVPSLICLLIEEENALSIIAKTLVNFFERAQRDNPITNFENRQNFDMQSLKRVFYVIADLRHLVNFVPTRWTDQLRKNVIEAVSIFISLLKKMQGMNSVRRQLGQHLEYEPDWESGMTIQSQLMGFITRIVTYCSSDEEVLIATLKEAQSQLLENGGYKKISKVLFGHEAYCIQYDVSTSPVSVHWPLNRFVAALINELMSRRPIDKVPYDESIIILNGCDGNGKSMIDIMEPSLRTEVMIAQFRSGMWRRNGYSLNYLILHFHGALMRKEMFDRDILVLQECAAVTNSNEFVIHLLNKFRLLLWASADLTKPLPASFFRNVNEEDMLTQTMALAEEFLQLLLTVVNERYRVGVGCIEEDDVIKYEIIQLLCISPATRSELSQKLCVTDKELDCIKAVANLKRSTEASTGKYELKDEYYSRFNPFFYHYTRGNQSNALDAQLKRKKNLKEKLICCPPAAPVELTKQFRYLNELLKCEVTLMIIARVLARTFCFFEENDPMKFYTSDLQLDQCLHLIGLGLYEQERDLLGFNYLQAAHDKSIFTILRQSYDEAKRNKDLFFWLMQKANGIIESIMSKHSDLLNEDSKGELMTIQSLFEPVLSECDTSKQENKRKSSEMAAQRRERIMTMMKAKQNKFLSNPTTKQLVAETETPIQSQSPQVSKASTSVVEDMVCDSEVDPKIIDDSQLCILCRDEQKVAFDQPTMVLLAYIQRSAVLSKNRGQRRIPNYALTPSNQLKYQRSISHELYSFTSDNSWSFDATFMPSDLFFGPHVSTCGHAMHFDCWQGFFDAILKRETSRPNRNQPHVSFDLEKFEILCPLCECISNATIPLLPNYTRFAQRQSAIQASPWNTIFNASPQTIEKSSENLSSCLHALRGTVDMIDYHFSVRHTEGISTKIVINHEDKYIRLLQPKAINEVLEGLNEGEALSLRDFINSIRSDKISSNECNKTLLSSVSTLAGRIHTVGLDLDKSITNVNHGRIFMSTSWSISYTIQAFERVSRFKGSPLFRDLESSKNLCLTSLLRFSLSSMMIHQSDMIQSLLVRKLRYLLINDEHLSSSPSCLDIDAFEMFVSLFILLQKLYTHMEHDSSNKSSTSTKEDYHWTTCAIDHEYFRNILHLMLILNMLQVIISIQNELTESYVDTQQEGQGDRSDGGEAGASMSSLPSTSLPQQQQPENSSQDCTSLCSFYNEIILASGHPNDRMPVVDGEFSSKLKARLLPFLRSCAILFYHLSQVAPPNTLHEKTAFLERKEPFHQRAEVMDGAVDAQKNFPDEEGIDLEAANEEYDSICQYLDLPTEFHHLLKSKEVRHLTRGWLRHSRVLILIKSALREKLPTLSPQTELMPVKFIRQPHVVNRLIELPYDYSELVDKVSDFTCPSIKNEDARTPTMCLVCGVILCSHSYCCQRDLNELASNYHTILQQQQIRRAVAAGSESATKTRPTGSVIRHSMTSNVVTALSYIGTAAALGGVNLSIDAATGSSSAPSAIQQQLVGSCTYHAHECSGGIGLFLRIRNCQILLLSGRSKGCYLPAPYIDDHGETDFGLRRGNPLHFNRQHYNNLQQMWLTHAIPEKISRTLEYSPYLSSINWHLH